MRKRVDEEPPDRPERPSRSQRKRDVEAITGLGQRLTELSPSALSQLELDEELLEEIHACEKLRRSARNRQIKLIGKMLRSRDHEAILEALEGVEPSRREKGPGGDRR